MENNYPDTPDGLHAKELNAWSKEQGRIITEQIIKQEQMETELTKQQLENVWFLTYNLLSNAGFEIYIDENGDGSMTVGHKNYEMVYDINGDKKLITK